MHYSVFVVDLVAEGGAQAIVGFRDMGPADDGVKRGYQVCIWLLSV